MDTSNQPFHSLRPDGPQAAPKCCPFCFGETLLTSWDAVLRSTRYQCGGCFEVFGRLPAPASGGLTSGEVVDIAQFRTERNRRRG